MEKTTITLVSTVATEKGKLSVEGTNLTVAKLFPLYFDGVDMAKYNIVVNNTSVTGSYTLKDGDIVSVFPSGQKGA